jgi:hypothetical protein
MIQHQIVVKDVREFQVTVLWTESDDLSWFLLRIDEGSVLISSDFGYVELVSKVSKEAVEEAVFTILRSHCDETNLAECVGLTSDDVKWRRTQALPNVIKHRFKEVKAIVSKAGSLDNARQQIAKLNRRDFIDVEGGSPVNMLELLLYSACKEPAKLNTFKLLARHIVLRVQVAWLRWLSRR